jgi:hypothetical protein
MLSLQGARAQDHLTQSPGVIGDWLAGASTSKVLPLAAACVQMTRRYEIEAQVVDAQAQLT